MARRKHVQTAHFCIARGLTRKGKTIKYPDGQSRFCPSIARAKRFMRTGSEERA